MLRSRGRRRTAYVGSTGHYRSPKSCRGSPRANGFAAPCGSRTRELTHHPPLSADDVLLDRQSLEGKEVRIQAYTACDGNVSPCFLFNDRTNFTKGLLFDGTGLPRLDRSRTHGLHVACAVPGDNYWSHLAGSPVHGDATYDRLGAGFTKATTTGDATGLRQGSSPLSVKDFLLDRATLIGREVSVQGDAQCSGTACWLTQEFTETTNCQLQGRRSPRADRKRLLDCDQLFSHGCAATVTGLVSGNELNAATIQWR